MSGLLGRLSSLSRKRLELLALDLQERLQRSEGTGREPIAIVGAACRFPGAPDLDAYWSLLAHGRDAVTDIPSDRWDVERHYSPDPDAPGKMYTRRGCFIDQPTRFDAAFFSISAREARAMDPQQRLLLETTWHALEHALIPPAILAGSRTGVFMGVSTTDYLQYSARTFELEQMDAYIGTGCAASVASGRLSYVLGLQGPSLPVDTACSSSLVAVHLACQSLNTGESDLALAGGVNLMLVQDTFIYFSRLRALAPDGRCKTFDATADGYGRGEGCGVLVLKRLSDALADGDDVLAIIRGSAVNHDGRSNGLTVPSGLAQEGVARDALRSAGVSATEIGYVEAHGTGTALGDPIELHAIGAVHKGRAAPLLVGSAKTNIGHLEAAAGVAGLLKLALMLRHRQVAPHLNLRLPNPYVDWANIPVEVACGKRSFPAPEGRLLGGVSSFGFGGTNAHVVLEAAEPRPPAERADRPERSQHLLCVSARSENALKQLAGTVALAAAETPSLADLCWSANAGRAHHEHRLILSAGDGAEAAHALDEWRAGREAPVGHAKGGSSPRPTVAFLFSGQGAQYAGMGRALYESEPLFRETIDECEKLLATEIDAPLREVLWGSATDLLDRTDHTQPALFAIEAALGRLWLSWGIVPRVALGHSVGEYSAAHMGGMFGLADGLALVAARGRLMQRLCPPGAMLALDCDEATAAKLIAGHEDMVAIAAVNGPASTVISGYPERIVAIRDTAGPLRTHPLTVSHAFHSPLMEPMLAAFAEVVAKIDFRRPAWTIISNVTGREARADELIDPGYWVRHVREPVRFAASLAASLDLGVDTMIEVGPKPVLLGMARASVPAGTRLLPSLQPPLADEGRLHETLRTLYLAGAPVDWRGFDRPFERRRAALPLYPFGGEVYWPKPPPRVAAAPATEARPALPDEDEPADSHGAQEWLYGVDWVAARAPPVAAEPGRLVVLFSDVGGVGEALAASLRASGCEIVLARRSGAFSEDGNGVFLLRPGDRGDYDRLLDRIGPPAAIVHLWSLDGGSCETDPMAAQAGGFFATLTLFQALLARGDRRLPRLCLVTRGSQAVRPGEATPGFQHGPLWGFGKVAALEYPQLRCFLADLDPSAAAADDEADFLRRLVLDEDRETLLALRGGEPMAARLVRRTPVSAPPGELTGAWLITGGLGGIGLLVADWLAQLGVRRLALIGRSPPDAAAQAAMKRISDKGAEVVVVRGDISDSADCARLVARAIETLGPIHGIVHAAGTMDNAPLPELDWGRCAEVIAPKLAGAWHLHKATLDQPISHFLLFSSVSSLLGSPGHGNYAPANAALDSFAAYRRGLGLPALAINWGAWAGVGMAAQLTGDTRARWDALGLYGSCDPNAALEALGLVIGSSEPQVAVLPTDWEHFFQLFPLGLEPAFLAPLAAEAHRVRPPSEGWERVSVRVIAAGPTLRREILADWLEEQLRAILGTAEDTPVDREAGFFDLGMDSLMSVEFRTRLQVEIGSGLALPITLAFDHPSIAKLSAHLERIAFPAEGGASKAVLTAPATGDDRIAIIGMGCRFPGGVEDPDAFWLNLRDSVDSISGVPSERWDADAYFDPDPDAPGKMNTRFGGFVEGIESFDAAFFNISPREATRLDPQQRMLLETSWRALEDAGLPPPGLAGTAAGVFVGVSVNDYPQVLARAGDIRQIDAYMGVGNALSMVAGRLAHFLGLRGPALSVDTACSSSLVAVHLACQSLRGGECGIALAGGVNAVLVPEVNIGLSKARMLAPDGRCKTFDAAADGYVRGEGCGVVALKRLADAERDGDRILAVIRSTAMNHDGRSSGLTVPNADAQEALLADCLAKAGLAPADVHYVEAHGTGTPLGDPIEVQALARVYGQDRPAGKPLLLGAVKTNIGHLESAAGMAGLIKTVQAIRHATLPATLHQHQPNPYVPWSDLAVEVVGATRPWPDVPVRRAGISSFGFSGTNAHLIIEQAPIVDADERDEPPRAQLLAVSARSRTALAALAADCAARLAQLPDEAVADFCRAMNAGRAALPFRIAARGATGAELAEALVAAAADPCDARAGQRRLAFLFSGQGSQWMGMGRGLFEDEPRFREAILACEAEMTELGGARLTDLLWGERAGDLDRTENTQPALFALEYALGRLWEAWGISPRLMLGHSVGEYAAACLSGIFDLPDACRLISARGRLMRDLCVPGAMVALPLGESQAGALLEGLEDKVGLAAVNGPESIVLSGEPEGIAEVSRRAEARGATAHSLAVSRAFHSPLMEPMLAAFAEVAAGVDFRPPERAIISSLSGTEAGAEIGTADYWVRHIREPVRFADAVATAVAFGANSFVEIGPAPVLLGMAARTISVSGARWLPSLRQGADERGQLLSSVATLWCDGADVDWRALHAPWRSRPMQVPNYPFERQRFWPDVTDAAMTESRVLGAPAAPADSLLGRRLDMAAFNGLIHEAEFSASAPAFLDDHRIYGMVVVPGASHLAMVFAAMARLRSDCGCVIADVAFEEVLVIPEGERRTIQLILTAEEGRGYAFQLFSHAGEGWVLHATGRAEAVPAESAATAEDLDAARGRSTDLFGSSALFYQLMGRQGIQLGPRFRWIEQVWRGEGEAVGQLRESTDEDGEADHPIHAGLLDSCFQLMGAALDTRELEAGAHIPIGIERLVLHRRPKGRLMAHVRLRERDEATPDRRVADLAIFDEDSVPVAEVRGLRIHRAPRAALIRFAERHLREALSSIRWRELPAPDAAAASPGAWLVFVDPAGVCEQVSARLAAAGARVATVRAGNVYERHGDGGFTIDAVVDEHYDRLLREAGGELGSGIGLLFGWSAESVANEAAAIDTALKTGSFALLRLAQAAARRGGSAARLAVLTRDAQPAGDGLVDLSHGAVPGLVRVLANEMMELEFSAIDLGSPIDEGALEALVAELLLPGGEREREVALRGGRRLVRRLARGLGASNAAGSGFGANEAYQLVRPESGLFDDMLLSPSVRTEPDAGEIEILVEATGLNFRDVLNVLGVYSGDAGPMGGECAGIVSAVGEGVAQFRRGDRVMAIGAGTFSRFTRTDARMACPIADELGSAEAATIPVAFVTAWLGLVEMAGLRAGESVLIHAGAGGVGLAAIQIARHLGAVVHATAGSEAKREFLRSLGVAHVYDSRSLEFAAGVAQATAGRGVDVVLNSLAGAFIETGVEATAPGGRFVEIGKNRIWTPAEMSAARPDIGYHMMALDEVIVHRPDEIGRMLAEIKALLETGALTPLPRTEMPITRVAEAFRYLAQARNIGKVVIFHEEATGAPETQVDRGGAYLITGGMGGLGLATARWLAELGAGRVCLLGRSAPSRAAAAAIEEIAALGTDVAVVQGNVCDEADVAAALAAARAAGMRLAGIFHAAGVLDDAPAMQLDETRFRAVLDAKLKGALHLDGLTRDDALDHFVLFSSAAALLGTPRQANYAAANGFLDALAHRRRSQGRPALSVNWGPWGGTGMAAESAPEIQRMWQAMGIPSISVKDGLATLELLLREQATQAVVLTADWARLADAFPGGPPPLIADIAETSRTPTGPSPEWLAFVEKLRATAPAGRQPLLVEHLRSHAARVLGLKSPADLDPSTPLNEAGLDSLMAVELANQISAISGVRLRVTQLFDYPTIEGLAGFYLAEVLELDEGPDASPNEKPVAPRDSAADMIESVSILSDEDVAERLLAIEAAQEDER